MNPKALDTRTGAAGLSKAMQRLVRQIDANGTPDHVRVEPGEDCLAGQCFDNVPAIVRRRGGEMLTGWILREVPTVFVEASFHAVWRGPDGIVADVTPRTDERTSIFFLPDAKTQWEGEEIESRRIMLHEQACYCGSGMPFKICHGLSDE